MSAPTTVILPVPPNGDRYWSIVTLAELLCVPPAAVDAHLAPVDETGESPDLLSPRAFVHYTADGEDYGDCFLTDVAADRIAAALPTGLLARRIADGHPAGTVLLGPDHIADLARHIVTHLGGRR